MKVYPLLLLHVDIPTPTHTNTHTLYTYPHFNLIHRKPFDFHTYKNLLRSISLLSYFLLALFWRNPLSVIWNISQCLLQCLIFHLINTNNMIHWSTLQCFDKIPWGSSLFQLYKIFQKIKHQGKNMCPADHLDQRRLENTVETCFIEVFSEDRSHAEGFISCQTLQHEKWEESILERLDKPSH